MASSRADKPDTAIYDEVDYEVMSDVPYELSHPALAQMQKLERGLRYILDNLRDCDMTIEAAAAHAGYSPGYFKALFAKHFEAPFERFVTMLRMRQAARDICDEHFPADIAARYGYASSASFSKAFRRELGISPRQFYKGNYAVPDMPLRSSLDGVKLDLDYTVERAFVLRGNTAPPPHGAQVFLMDELALPFSGKYPQFENATSMARAGHEGGAGHEVSPELVGQPISSGGYTTSEGRFARDSRAWGGCFMMRSTTPSAYGTTALKAEWNTFSGRSKSVSTPYPSSMRRRGKTQTAP